MLRTALRPKWLAMLALALALASGFAWLGSWQWDRSRAEADERELREQAAADPVALSEVLAPQQALDGEAGRATVLVSGDLVAADARVSPARELDGRTGGWVVAPVVVDGADPVPGARLAVVLGWQPGSDVPDLDGGAVDLTGVLRSPESPSGTPADDATLETVATADLVNLWGGPLYSAYLVASADDARAAGLEPVPDRDRVRRLRPAEPVLRPGVVGVRRLRGVPVVAPGARRPPRPDGARPEPDPTTAAETQPDTQPDPVRSPVP